MSCIYGKPLITANGQIETFGLLENIAHQRQVLVAKLTAMFATE